jgi:predicted TIM-barrel fold metal-dependent hydrolase
MRANRLILLAAAYAFASLSLHGQQKAPAGTEDALRIIDAHCHTVFTGAPEPFSHIVMTREEFLKEMRENNVVGAVAHTGLVGDYHEDLKSLGVVFGLGVLEKVDEAKIEQELKSKKYKCIKIYLGYVHRYACDAAYEPVYKMAEKYDVPVVFHTGDTYDAKAKVKYADPLTVDEVAVDHPKVRFIIAHCGNPWIQSAAEVAYKNPNVYLDLSGIMVGEIDKYPEVDIEQFLIKPIQWIFKYVGDEKKFMFGTDWPLVNMGQYIKVIKRAIPKESWPAVFHDSAVRVFKLDV